MRNISKDLTKDILYDSVKTLIECEIPHIHLNQHKLFSLFSIAFQYFLFQSTKVKGHYIIRIEDSFLANKLVRRAKDQSTRKFINTLLIPRRLKSNDSYFYLDFFNLTTWNNTSNIPPSEIKGAIIVKNTTDVTVKENIDNLEGLPPKYYLTSLLEVAPKTITIAYKEELNNIGLEVIRFPFIKDKTETMTTDGVVIAPNLDPTKFKE